MNKQETKYFFYYFISGTLIHQIYMIIIQHSKQFENMRRQLSLVHKNFTTSHLNIASKITVSRKITVNKLGIWYLFWISHCGYVLQSHRGY